LPSLVVPNAAQLRLIWGISGVPAAVNVLGVSKPGAVVVNQTLANTVSAAVKSGFTSSAFNTQLGTAVSLMTVGLRDISSANQAEYVGTGAAVAGTGAAHLLPLNASLCVTLRTAQAGRSYRGRCFLWGFTEAQNSATGTVESGVGTSAEAFLTAIKAALVSSGMDLGVISGLVDSSRNPPKAAFVTPVTTVQVRDSVWDTQRRRATAGI
jgi:hypothetical protein